MSVLDFFASETIAFGRWHRSAPIDVDSSCQSFLVEKLLQAAIRSVPGANRRRSMDQDAMFRVALNTRFQLAEGLQRLWFTCGLENLL
jgi:hypothetical protein